MSEKATSSSLADVLPMIRVDPPGPMSLAWAARLEGAECPAFGARRRARAEVAGAEMAPVVYASGSGCNVVDVDGNRYVDLAAGFGALLLGHGAPRIARAIELQAARLWMALGDLYPSDAKIALVEQLAELYPAKGARALLGQSGSDAVSAALKTAKLATGKPGAVAFEGSYHGLGYGPLAALGLRASWREAFADQLNPHVSFAPYPAETGALDASLSAVEKALAAGNVGAVLVEPVLGRGGCVVPPPSFLPELAKLARRAGALLVADEIWTGLGRTGHMFASMATGVVPDLLCLGKGLGGGLPISACLGSDEIMQAWRRKPAEEVVHTATFHGAPLACAAALATLETLREEQLYERAAWIGEVAQRALVELFAAMPGRSPGAGPIGGFAVRGAGLMIGIQVGTAAIALALQRALLAAGWLVTTGGMSSEVLVLTPPLVISSTLLEAFVAAFGELLEDASEPSREA
jgi:4-aminobutyrate aminotransferase/(S)-3-amino-2-methylpropionate transaminase